MGSDLNSRGKKYRDVTISERFPAMNRHPQQLLKQLRTGFHERTMHVDTLTCGDGNLFCCTALPYHHSETILYSPRLLSCTCRAIYMALHNRTLLVYCSFSVRAIPTVP